MGSLRPAACPGILGGMDKQQLGAAPAEKRPWWRVERDEAAPNCGHELHPDDTCPVCGEGKLAYNGLFQLECRRCQAIADPGTFT